MSNEGHTFVLKKKQPYTKRFSNWLFTCLLCVINFLFLDLIINPLK